VPDALDIRIDRPSKEQNMKHVKTVLGLGACLLVSSAAVVLAADPHPYTVSGTGQPGSHNGISCLSTTAGGLVIGGGPGNSPSAPGSAFNPSGTAGTVYAGNPGTASAAHAASPNAVAQYDVACFQATQIP
jgi:hypothetical protein